MSRNKSMILYQSSNPAMKKILFYVPLLLSVSLAYAQDISVIYANTITSDELKSHLEILASDALEGRETGERGQKMAAAYIKYEFRKDGLEPVVATECGPSFLQTFDLVKMNMANSWIKVGEKSYTNFKDFVYASTNSFVAPQKSRLVFVGEGTADDFNAIPVKGKNVLMYCNGDQADRDKLAKAAKNAGAIHVFIVPNNEAKFKEVLDKYKPYGSGRLRFPLPKEELSSPYFVISPNMAVEILNTKEDKILNALERSNRGKYASLIKMKSQEITFNIHYDVNQVPTENVLGMIPGTDKKNEYIMVTAHYDHIGVDGEEINNGADDDGSGTVTVLEIAQAFAQARADGHGPRRSVVFMTVSGEEKGLLGSKYYVTHPVIPLANTITDLNIDMVGRIDPAHEADPNYIYLIGSDKLSTTLHAVSEQVNAKYSGLELDYKYNAESDPNRFYYRSDHYNFAKNNIPVIFYFNGTHADYHKPTDTVEKINFELMEKRARLIFHTAWEIANREDRITVDVKPEESN